MARAEKLIGIMGHAGHGKDAVARILVENHGYTRRAFADALKADIAKLLFSAADRHTEQAQIALTDRLKNRAAVRSLLQAYGTAQREIRGPDYWTWRWQRWCDQHAPNHCIVVPDVRFPEEHTAIKQRGGTLIRVIRPDYDNGLTEEQQAHPSETALNGHPADYTITNDGTLDDLANTVEAWLFNVLWGGTCSTRGR